MGKEPLISIVMPVYNAEKYVDMAIQSVVEQTFLDWELIIVNDKSTDNSGKLCDAWAEKEKRIRVIHLLENKGAGNARNVGIDEARGKYLTFLDSDDQIDGDLYNDILEAARETNIDVYVWGVTEQYYDQSNTIVRENKLSLPTKVYRGEKAVHRQIILLEDKTLFGYQWNHLYRCDLLRNHKIYFEKVILYEDYFFNMEFIKYAQSMCVVDNTGYYYAKRMNQSITNKYVEDYFSLSRRRVFEMLTAYKEWDLLNDTVKQSCGNRYLRYICSTLMRNNDKRAEMTIKKKICWIKNISNDNLYIQVAKDCKTHQILLKLTQTFINKNFYLGLLFIGKVLYLMKYRFPILFSKKSEIK